MSETKRDTGTWGVQKQCSLSEDGGTTCDYAWTDVDTKGAEFKDKQKVLVWVRDNCDIDGVYRIVKDHGAFKVEEQKKNVAVPV